MRKISGTAIALLLGATAFVAPASAATMVTTTGTPLNETIKTSSGVDGNLVTFFSDPSHYAIDYSSTSTLHPSSTGGFAFVEGVGSNGFADLTLTPQTITFSALKFNMQLPASTGPSIPNGYKTDFTFDTTVFFSGGGSENFDTDVGAGNGQNRYLITAGLNQAIDKVVFSDLVGVSTKHNDPTLTNSFNFDSLRQVSFDAISAVPEPSTWALFILGFGGIGLMLRSGRGRSAIAVRNRA